MPDDRSRADRPPTLNKELLLSDLNAQFENISDKGSEDAAQIFARNAATIAFDDLPPAAVRAAKLGVLDTLGVILAATGSRLAWTGSPSSPSSTAAGRRAPSSDSEAGSPRRRLPS